MMEPLPQPSWRPILCEDIDDAAIYSIYRQMARVLLELAVHDLDKIGAFLEVKRADGRRTWPISSRPLTLKMNEIVREGNVAMDGKSI